MTEAFPYEEQPWRITGEERRDYRVEILSAYDPQVAAGIGRLMPQLDESFSGEPTSQDKLETIIADPDRCQLVAFDPQGEVAAAATMNTLRGYDGSAEGWLEDFIVDENARGSGLASQMYQSMKDWCARQGLSQFSYGTETWREEAVPFYTKKGAQLAPEVKHVTARVGRTSLPSHDAKTYTLHMADDAEHQGVTQVSVTSASGQLVGSLGFNTLMGAGKQSEGWFDDMSINPDFEYDGVRSAIMERLWEGVNRVAIAHNLPQFSFAMSDPEMLAFCEEQGAEADPHALHYTQPVEQ